VLGTLKPPSSSSPRQSHFRCVPPNLSTHTQKERPQALPLPHLLRPHLSWAHPSFLYPLRETEAEAASWDGNGEKN
jgi:hypothetical protein